MPRKPKETGLEAARLYCQWHLGDRYWADLVLEAYLNPDDALAELYVESDGDLGRPHPKPEESTR
jgi:hypothetical protein